MLVSAAVFERSVVHRAKKPDSLTNTGVLVYTNYPELNRSQFHQLKLLFKQESGSNHPHQVTL